jgi:transcriptional regulator
MYLPRVLEETDPATLRGLIRAHPLGMWVTQAGSELVGNHIPFLLDADRGPFGTLVGHVARANPVWESFSTTVASLIVFRGADSYITPSWYPSKRVHGRAVPTWNYAVVHAHGVPRVFEDRDRLLAHVTALTNTHESSLDAPWHVSDAPADFIDAMLRGIVGIEIPIATLTGKWKVSQNRPEADRRAVVAALRQREDGRSQAMAALVQEAIDRGRSE